VEELPTPSYSPLREDIGLQHINYWLVKAFKQIDQAYWQAFCNPPDKEK
jgi:hypothetical protein